MSHIYSDTFFDYINQSARASAQPLIGHLYPLLKPTSVLDLGSGRGVWLEEWQRSGAQSVLGVDGDYVERDGLAIAQSDFLAADLTKPVETGRRFDLAQSLEVGEHLPTTASETLVDSLTKASDRVLFSAAVKGQGGEFHINEQPLSFWQAHFEARGYRAYDCVRPALKHNSAVAPWYRFNSILYVNAAGRAGLSQEILDSEVPKGMRICEGGNAMWRLRRNVVSYLPRGTVTQIAQVRAAILAKLAQIKSNKTHLSA